MIQEEEKTFFSTLQSQQDVSLKTAKTPDADKSQLLYADTVGVGKNLFSCTAAQINKWQGVPP